MFTNYNKNRLISFVTQTNYFMFGIAMALYVLSICILISYSTYVPYVATIAYSKICENKFAKSAKSFAIKCKFDTLCHWIEIIGDTCKNLCVARNASSNGEIILPNHDNIEEYLSTDDEDLTDLNRELDKMLQMGTSILAQTMAGRKSEQAENAKKFMDTVNKSHLFA